MTSSQSEPCVPVKLRVVQEKDFDQVVEMIKAEDFYLPRIKLEIAVREGQSDFYVLEDISTNDGKILGVANVSETRSGEAVLGNVAIRKDYRHQGLGTYMLRHVFRLHDVVTMSWFSAADDLYTKLGCKFSCPQTFCYLAVDLIRDKVKQYCEETCGPKDSVSLLPLTDDRREALIQYDADCRGYENRKFISLLRGFAENIILAVAGGDKRIVGYAASCGEDGNVVRLNGLFADDDIIAALLLRHTLMDNYPKIDRAKFVTLCNRRFLAQFGDIVFDYKNERASTGQITPAPIPENKVYSLSDPDVSS